jgi:hypothetical protein
MTRVSELNDCCRDERCGELAARVFGGLGLKSRDVLAAMTEGPTRRKGREPGREPCRPDHEGAWAAAEVSLSEALADPIVMSLMAADGVDPAALETNLAELAVKLARRRA